MADEEDGDRPIYELRGGDQRFVLVFDSIGIAAESLKRWSPSLLHSRCYICIVLFLVQCLLRSLSRGLHAAPV